MLPISLIILKRTKNYLTNVHVYLIWQPKVLKVIVVSSLAWWLVIGNCCMKKYVRYVRYSEKNSCLDFALCFTQHVIAIIYSVPVCQSIAVQTLLVYITCTCRCIILFLLKIYEVSFSSILKCLMLHNCIYLNQFMWENILKINYSIISWQHVDIPFFSLL